MLTRSCCPTAVIAALCFLPEAGWAADRFVDGKSSKCSDGGNGSADEPWCRLKAAGTKARPGDKVLVKGGTYREKWVIKVSGTKDKPIIFAAAQGETPVLDGTKLKLDEEGMIDLEKQQHIVIRGLTIKFSPWYAINVSGCSDIVVERVTVKKSIHGGIVFDEACSNVKALNNDVRGTDSKGQENGIHEAITMSKVKGFLVAGNHVHHGVKEGIDAKDGSRDGEIRDNLVENMGQVGIYLNHATKVKVYRNRIHHCGSSGIQLAVGDFAMGERRTSDNDIYQNLIWRNRYNGVQFWREKSGEMKKNRIYNNVLYGNKHSGILLEDTSGNIIKNNIIAKNGHAGIGGDAAPKSTASHNLFFGNGDDETQGSSAVSGDPLLVNPDGGDFKLKAGSPAIDAGTKVGLAFSGKAPDIGALEFGTK